jgi:hypothetical protein
MRKVAPVSLNGRCLRCGRPIHAESPDALDFFWRCSVAGKNKCLRVNGEPPTSWVIVAVLAAITLGTTAIVLIQWGAK